MSTNVIVENLNPNVKAVAHEGFKWQKLDGRKLELFPVIWKVSESEPDSFSVDMVLKPSAVLLVRMSFPIWRKSFVAEYCYPRFTYYRIRTHSRDLYKTRKENSFLL